MPKIAHNETWQDYENNAYDLFRSTGHRCQRDVILQGVRGSHQIDVVVDLAVPIGNHRWLVECKHWSRRVGKRDLQSFKTAIDDIGADHGYLLSEKGFQKGAREMASTLNISLCSLSELREHFVREQLTHQHQQSKEFKVDIEYEEDLGNMDSEAILELNPVNNFSVSDHIIEIHVIREGKLNWVLPTEAVRKLLTPDGRLIISLPWNPIRLCGVCLKNGSGIETEEGVEICGPYRVIFRTLSGPVSINTYVPMYK